MPERIRSTDRPTEAELGHYADLERYLISLLTDGQLYRYHALPRRLTAGAIETYANWLADLTAANPDQCEFGANVFYDDRKGKLVFMTNPQTGKGAVQVLHTKNPACHPVTITHSHPDTSCFSDMPGDLFQFLLKRDLPGNFAYLPADHLASQGCNFLMLRTADTPPDPSFLDGFFKDMEVNLMLLDLNLDMLSPWHLPPDDYLQIFQPLANYYIAKNACLGFYLSHKDGHYRRINYLMVKDLIVAEIRNRFGYPDWFQPNTP